MRLKEFLIVVGIFTVGYIIFFVIYDFFSLSLLFKGRKKIQSNINYTDYKKFAAFYGLEKTVATEELIKKINSDYQTNFDSYLLAASKNYKIDNYEYIVIILYLEYLNLVVRRNINYSSNIIKNFSQEDANYIKKYKSHFEKKKTYSEIIKDCSGSVANELIYINNSYLFPGVRILNNIVYYYDEKGTK